MGVTASHVRLPENLRRIYSNDVSEIEDTETDDLTLPGLGAEASERTPTLSSGDLDPYVEKGNDNLYYNTKERSNKQEYIESQNARKPPNPQDYAHLEPPLALPSIQKLRPVSREKLEEQDRPKSSIEKIPVDEHKDYMWWRVPQDFKQDERPYHTLPWSDDGDDDYQSDAHIFQQKASRQKKSDTLGKLIDSTVNSMPSDKQEYERSSQRSENLHEQPNPVYLPIKAKSGNKLYSSLVDMINSDETKQMKRPVSARRVYTSGGDHYSIPYDDSNREESESDDEKLNIRISEDDVIREDPESKEHEEDIAQVFPQVAKVQDRGVSEDVIMTDQDWALPRMGPWDPADTPVATAVLGSVMLFLILVVVSIIF